MVNAMWLIGFTTADWTAESDQLYAHFGDSVSSAGDVNGDGYADVIVGAPDYDNGESGEGRAFTYLGSAAGLAAAPVWTAEPDSFFAFFGGSVGGGGNVNGDGYDDVIVGAKWYENGQESEGRASVYHGTPTGLETYAAWSAEGNETEAYFGNSVAIAGDLNGDGFDDVIVGAYWFGDTNAGRAFVYNGSPTGLSTSTSWTGEPNEAGAAWYGLSVASAGDINGDGFDEVLVGAPYVGDEQFDNGGRTYLYLGSASGLGADAAWVMEPGQPDAFSGGSVSSAGDVNADGYDDVLVGALDFDDPDEDEGLAMLFLGSAAGLETVAAWTAEGNAAGANLGWPVSSAGDLNADGYDDVVVGASHYDAGTFDGEVLGFLGNTTGLDTAARFVLVSDQVGSDFGDAVAGAGDVDGDGYDDLLVGSGDYSNGETTEGQAYLYRGTCMDSIDTDADHVGDLCDVCPTLFDPMQEDNDSDGIGDACDPCPANEPDTDGDGFCVADCDDNNATVYLGAPELCDGLDNSCSGAVPVDELDEDGDGEPICAGDCDDEDPERSPAALEEDCNDIDDDCDGRMAANEIDDDGDHVTECAGDCNDANPLVSSKLFDVCGDDIDNNCDGAVDEDCEADAPSGCTCGGTGAGANGPWLALSWLLGIAGAWRRRSRPR